MSTQSPESGPVPGWGGGMSQGGRVSQEVAFELLSNRRRRHVLHVLKQRRERISLRSLSTQIAAWENGVSPARVSYDQRMRVYTTLRQVHLPKLHDGGIVRWDDDRGTVELTSAATQLEIYLDVVPHDDVPWSVYYVGLGVLSLGLVSSTWLELQPFADLSHIVVALLVALALTASAVLHWRHDRRTRVGADGQPPDTREEWA